MSIVRNVTDCMISSMWHALNNGGFSRVRELLAQAMQCLDNSDEEWSNPGLSITHGSSQLQLSGDSSCVCTSRLRSRCEIPAITQHVSHRWHHATFLTMLLGVPVKINMHHEALDGDIVETLYIMHIWPVKGHCKHFGHKNSQVKCVSDIWTYNFTGKICLT